MGGYDKGVRLVGVLRPFIDNVWVIFYYTSAYAYFCVCVFVIILVHFLARLWLHRTGYRSLETYFCFLDFRGSFWLFGGSFGVVMVGFGGFWILLGGMWLGWWVLGGVLG